MIVTTCIASCSEFCIFLTRNFQNFCLLRTLLNFALLTQQTSTADAQGLFYDYGVKYCEVAME